MAKPDEKRKIAVELTLEQFRTLWRLAYIDGHMPEEIARRVLTDYLERNEERSWSRVREPRPMSEAERLQWQKEFEAAVAAMRAGAEDDDGPIDIEDEITAAVEEVRRERYLRQQAAGA